MAVKLFILGLPGSGKSAVARFILKYVNGQRVDERNDQCWSAIRFNDYTFLLDMYHQDTAWKRFKPASPGGFDVLDLKVFDEALQTLEQEVDVYVDSLNLEEKKLVLVEFSRNDYERAFQQFNKSFLKDAHFIYLDTELEKCKQRICLRSVNPKNPADDYPVSEYIFEVYYYSDDGLSIADLLAKEYGVDKWRVLTIDNNCSLELVCKNIEPFIHSILNPLSIVNK